MCPTDTTSETRERLGSPALLLTKLHPPPWREQTVMRDRLVEQLRLRPEVKLTVVAAPAGCGKTTLLGTWRDAEATRRPVAWVTVDEGDDDAVVLWSHVLEALRRVCPDLAVSSSPEAIGTARIADVLLPQLVNALVEQGEVALILDDFHRLSSGPARDSVAWLAEHAPSTFHIVLATRSEPALPLATLRARGQLHEVRAADLGFNNGEADALLNDRLHLGIAREDVDRLVNRTEGWPAGLYLAGLSLGGVEDRQAFVQSFGATNSHVVDFLVDEVLDAHDPEMQNLMLRTSVLERVCGSLCDALLEQEGSAGRLRELARTNLFLIPLDDRGDWFRFHHLFAQLLRVELEYREPGVVPVLRQRAFAWHRDHGSNDEAIDQALEAGLFGEAAELITAIWPQYTDTFRFETLLGWLDRFPSEWLGGDPNLLLVAAWVRSLAGERQGAADAEAALRRLGPLDRGPLPDGFSSAEASLVTLRSMYVWGDWDLALANGRRAAELEEPGSRWRATVCVGLGAQLYVHGELDDADRWLKEVTDRLPLDGRWLTVCHALVFRSLVAGEQGRVEDQAQLARQAEEVSRNHGLEEVIVQNAMGASLAAQGQPEEALARLDRSLEVLRRRGHPMPLTVALIQRATALQALGRDEAAADAIAEARATIEGCSGAATFRKRLAALDRPPKSRRQVDGAISDRELAVLRMLGGTLSERDIGRELYLSHNTIHSHTRSIYRKLGVSSRTEAVKHAREVGLI